MTDVEELKNSVQTAACTVTKHTLKSTSLQLKYRRASLQGAMGAHIEIY